MVSDTFTRKYGVGGRGPVMGEPVRGAAHAEPKPARDDAEPHTCPFCQQPYADDRATIGALLVGGTRRLQVALWMIAGAVLRCLRFLVGGLLCLIGLIGDSCRLVGVRIAHPRDRRFLPRRS